MHTGAMYQILQSLICIEDHLRRLWGDGDLLALPAFPGSGFQTTISQKLGSIKNNMIQNVGSRQ